MKVGDLVKIKHAPEVVGLITAIAPNDHESLTYRVMVDFLNYGRKQKVMHSFQLEIISESR